MPGDKIKGKDKLRIIDILHHVAGFPADPQYPNKNVAGKLFSQSKSTTLEMIKKDTAGISTWVEAYLQRRGLYDSWFYH